MSICDPLSIGRVTVANRVFLAPMSGVSDLPFRRLAQRFGAGLAFSEMVASREMVRQTRQSERRSRRDAGSTPMAVQLAGTDPEVMAEAARAVADRGADLIDINFGCPAKKIIRKAAGSALMRDEPLARAIIEAVVKAVDVPVSVKMRTGWDDASRNAPQLAHIAEDCGVQMITVHGRTRCQFYTGTADWHFIQDVRQAVRIPLIANGDIQNAADARACLAASGADGVMIGRAAQGRPWLPGHIAATLSGRDSPAEPTPTERAGIARQHLREMLQLYGTETGLRNARKHMGWYAAGLPGGNAFRQVVNNTTDPAIVERAIERFFTAWAGPVVAGAAA